MMINTSIEHGVQSMKVKVLVTQSCPALCDSVDCSPPGSSVHGILQARILEWVAISFSKRSFLPRDQTVSPALAGGLFTTVPPGKPWQTWTTPESLELTETIHAS